MHNTGERRMNSQGGYDIQDLQVGQTASIAKTVTETDIVLYAGLSTDINPVHLNEDFARTTPFKTRIAHGMLTAGFISAVLANKLPGPGTVYLGQTLKFKAPVRAGDTVVATATIKEVLVEKRRTIVETICRVGETVVLEGEATLLCTSAA
ncbi:MAG: (R)-hydratase [Rhodocyclales bacterium GT-UBC]|nr:MAG: (R)-hydratase [Rhodocyclales bacterium GT-UBC]